MTREEVLHRVDVPPEVLAAYERWCTPNGAYREADIAELSLTATLLELGFRPEDAGAYLRAHRAGEQAAQLRLLRRRREELLQELHSTQEKLDKLDYLRYRLQKR